MVNKYVFKFYLQILPVTQSTKLMICGKPSVDTVDTELYPIGYLRSAGLVGMSYTVLKWLRLILEGFVVKMHVGACETGSPIPRPLGRVIWRTLRYKPGGIVTNCNNKTLQIGLVAIVTTPWRREYHNTRRQGMLLSGRATAQLWYRRV